MQLFVFKANEKCVSDANMLHISLCKINLYTYNHIWNNNQDLRFV